MSFDKNHLEQGNDFAERRLSDAEYLKRGSVEDAAHEPPATVASWSPEERHRREVALVRKIDLRLIPMIILMYILNYLDRNNIAAARLAGMEDELKLVGDQYQVGSRGGYSYRSTLKYAPRRQSVSCLSVMF